MAQLTDLLNDIREGNYKDANATIFDALYLKIEESIEDRKEMSEASDKGDDEELDDVDKKELKGKHKDRDDKDIDNDGDVDSSDKYLHKKRKAISKAVSNDEGAEMDIAKEKEKMASSQEKIRDLAIQMKKEKQRKRAEA
jgi:hypothetical protein